MLSEFEIIVNTSGVTIICPYLYTPRFIPFDLKGRCKTCKSDNVEIDYIIQPEGITIFCSRLKKEKFVPFDKSAKFNENDAEDIKRTVRIRSRSKSYNIPISRTPKERISLTPPLVSPPFESVDDEMKVNVKNQSDVPLNISDVSSLSNVLSTRTPTSLITLSRDDRTLEIPENISLNSLSHDALSPDGRTPQDVNISDIPLPPPPSPPPLIVSPISFFPDL